MGPRTDWDTEPNPTYDIWTSVNGSEIVPGVLSPFSATSFNRYDSMGLRELMSRYPGGDEVKLFDPPVGNFFGVVAGRLCLNNGFSVAATSMLDADIAQAILQQFFTGATGGERFIADATDEQRAAAYAEATRQREAAPGVLDGYRDRLYAERDSGRAREDRDLPLTAAVNRYVELAEDNACELLNTHYVISVGAGEWQVRLAGVLVMAGLDPALVVGLCSGLGEVESSLPAVHLYEVAQLVRAHPAVASLLRSDLDAAVARLTAPPSADTDTDTDTTSDTGWAEVAARFQEFLRDYGYRGQGEADPTNPDWAEQPTFALSSIRSMLDVDEAESPRATIASAVAARQRLEATTRQQIPAELGEAFDATLAQAQHFTRMRERSKAMWVIGTRRARAPFLAIGDGLAEAGLVADPDDTRFLTLAEIEALAGIDGAPTALSPNQVADAVARRRAQTAEAEQWDLPDNWVGEPELTRRGAVDEVDSLTGIGVSAGAGPVTGKARIIPSAQAGLAQDIEVGEILVAPFTDAPWTPLFIPAGAVVVETGGVISHAATVAREFAIPAVVMCKRATEIIHDGDIVTVDGAAGTVTIESRAG
ncbi:MAG: PEP-utilizing enzyme [Acidimicrobiales bacterium]